jgi:hypothetical protein
MKRTEKLEKQAERLTEELPPGTRVNFWPGVKDGPPRTGNIKHPFTVLSGTTVVGWIDTARGCIAASHIERA